MMHSPDSSSSTGFDIEDRIHNIDPLSPHIQFGKVSLYIISGFPPSRAWTRPINVKDNVLYKKLINIEDFAIYCKV